VTVSGFTGTPDQTVDQTEPSGRGGTAGRTAPPGRAGTRQRPDAPRPIARGGRARLRYRPDWALIAGPAVTLAMMLWGLTAPAYWGDEADTVSAVSRSLPQLLRMLRHVDAVHGLYYLALWPVTRVLGTGEFATRLPSALAMAAAALGIAAIARRLASPRAALWAGLLFAALPMISVQGHDARPYGMVAGWPGGAGRGGRPAGRTGRHDPRRPTAHLAQVAAARLDAHAMHVGWVLVWPQQHLRHGTLVRDRNPGLLSYLGQTGFRFAYRADGVLVYRAASGGD
jgi:hypothetical protein